MIVILSAFTAFHAAVGLASLGLAVRLLTPREQAHWRSKPALVVAALLSWVYPALAFFAVRSAWSAYAVDHHLAVPMLLAPIFWLIVMGAIFAVVDFVEDGVLGNARSRE
ncbi:MAG: hypothetical protein K2P58_06275 [Hyphomonadaceae bacterium]|nr:hypothetical protein [Hyphomonadaceae bacterium]